MALLESVNAPVLKLPELGVPSVKLPPSPSYLVAVTTPVYCIAPPPNDSFQGVKSAIVVPIPTPPVSLSAKHRDVSRLQKTSLT